MKGSHLVGLCMASIILTSCTLVPNGQQIITTEDGQLGQWQTDYSRTSKSPSGQYNVKALVAKRDAATLLSIVKENRNETCEAIVGLMTLLTPSEAVAFCSMFNHTDVRWFLAFDCIGMLPRTEAIPYIKQVATSSEAWVRGMCYRACLQAGWDDLLDYASMDSDNNTLVGFPNQPHDERTVGDIARKYIAACAKIPYISPKINAIIHSVLE